MINKNKITGIGVQWLLDKLNPWIDKPIETFTRKVVTSEKEDVKVNYGLVYKTKYIIIESSEGIFEVEYQIRDVDNNILHTEYGRYYNEDDIKFNLQDIKDSLEQRFNSRTVQSFILNKINSI